MPCSVCRPGRCSSDTDRLKFHGDQHYLKTAGGDAAAVRRGPFEPCDNSLWIAERCRRRRSSSASPQLPDFPLPEGFASDTEYLRHLTYEGAAKPLGAVQLCRRDVVERLDFELQCHRQHGVLAPTS